MIPIGKLLASSLGSSVSVSRLAGDQLRADREAVTLIDVAGSFKRFCSFIRN